MSYIRHHDKKGNVVDCHNCRYAKHYAPYPPTFKVCVAPEALEHHGGKRSAGDIVRAPGGACQPHGSLFAPVTGGKKKEAPQGNATARRSSGPTSDDGVLPYDDA